MGSTICFEHRNEHCQINYDFNNLFGNKSHSKENIIITFKPDELYIKKFKKRKRMRKYKSNIYLNK